MTQFKHWLTSIFYVIIRPTPTTFRKITKDVKGENLKLLVADQKISAVVKDGHKRC